MKLSERDKKVAVGAGLGLLALFGLAKMAKAAPPSIVEREGKYYCPYGGEELIPRAGGIPPIPDFHDLDCPLGHGKIRCPGTWLALDLPEVIEEETIMPVDEPDEGDQEQLIPPPATVPMVGPQTSRVIIMGHARKRYSTQPLVGAKVDVYTTEDWKTLTPVATYFTNSSGDFRTGEITIPAYPGITNFQVSINAEGYKSLASVGGGFQIIGGRPGTLQYFQLVSDAALLKEGEAIPYGLEASGRVESTTGKDIRGATVWYKEIVVLDQIGRPTRETGIVFSGKTNQYGMYEIPLVPPGQYITYAEATSYRSSDRSIERVPVIRADKSWVGLVRDFKLEAV